MGHPGIIEANPVIAHGITVGWHYVAFQKLAGLAMSGMAAHVLLRLVHRRFGAAWPSFVHGLLVMPALLYFVISASNLRLGLMASGVL